MPYIPIAEARGFTATRGKECLMVFDFIDNASMFNLPYCLHRMFNIKDYKAGEYVVASQKQFQLDWDLIARGEKPFVFLDFPVDVADYELIDLFNWQDEVKDMISQIEFVRMVDAQTETIERYIREGKIVVDLEVPFGDNRSFKYFSRSNR